LMKLSALTLGAFRFIIAISFWCIAPFISMKWPYLLHFTKVSLKSILSDISIATPACFRGTFGLVNLLPAFYLKPVLISVIKMDLLETTDFWIFPFNPVCQMEPFDGELSPLTIMLILIGI
jgi:hypothetical protein